MTRFPARRTFAALLLGLSLVAASASALEPRLRPEPGTTRWPSSPCGSWVLYGLRAFLSSIWDKNGGSLDPNGSHLGQPPGPGDTSDAGASLDPNG